MAVLMYHLIKDPMSIQVLGMSDNKPAALFATCVPSWRSMDRLVPTTYRTGTVGLVGKVYP